jgi:hypothetical protein
MRFAFTMLCLVIAPLGTAAAESVPPDHAEKLARGKELFAKHVRSLLAERCLKCHGGDKTRSGLDLHARETLLKGGDNGPVVVPFDSKSSRLVKLVAHRDDPHMPPKEVKLPDQQIGWLTQWIDLGAPYDRPLLDRGTMVKKPLVVTDEDRRFWSFQLLQRPTVPSVNNHAWVRTPIDAFILARLEAKGLAPNPETDKRKLLRRVSFDLLGLPPTSEELDAFLKDQSPGAYDQVLDRLLASPHHGERWARHWLDLARFAESHGFEHDYDRPTAYHYRDFVIKALNRDLPYDKFVQWQIAGDEFEPDNPLALMATGFLAAGVHSTQITANLVEKERYDELDDMVRTIGTAMLGLTVGCARCHDHKFDPVPTRDYYRMLSTFTTTVRSEVELNLDPAGLAAARAKWDAEHARIVQQRTQYESEELPGKLTKALASGKPLTSSDGKPIPKEVAEILQQIKSKLTAEQNSKLLAWFKTQDRSWQELNRKVQEHDKTAPRQPKVLICSEGLPPVRLHTQGADFFNETYFLTRGDPNQKQGVATQSFPQVLMRLPDQEKHWQVSPPSGCRTSYRRRSLANWITDLDQGAGHLLARVIVNRLWQHHFGRGLVGTPSDFGFQGEKPSHPELLDWLAGELVDHGWSLRYIHKLILSSNAYRQSAQNDLERARVDPENRLHWRHQPTRLEAEVIRDNLLAVSGALDRRQFGPGTLDPNMKRRSIYFTVKRSQLITSMVLFDAPDGLQGIEQRTTTTIAPQALLMLNSPLVRDCARQFAQRISPRGNEPTTAAVQHGYLLALGRPASPLELEESARFVREQAAEYQKANKPNAQTMALTDFCQALLGLNEFIYVE